MKEKGFEFWNALNFVRSRRSIICPNMGFMRQLQEYEKALPKKAVEEQKVTKATEYSSRSIDKTEMGPAPTSSKALTLNGKTMPIPE